MTTTTRPLRLTTVRPTAPARRALLALAEALARLAVHRADHRIEQPADARTAATRASVEESRRRDRDRWIALAPPLR